MTVHSEEDEDARLMERVGAGDKAAFATLFDRYQGPVVRFAWRFVGSRGRAEELAQEIFFKLYRSAKSYRPSAKFKTFLFRVATNHCLDVRRLSLIALLLCGGAHAQTAEEHFNALPEARREELRERMRTFKTLPPEEQQ